MARVSLRTSSIRIARILAVGVAAVAAWLFVGTPGAGAATDAAPCSSAARACVDLSSQQAWIMHDGVVDYGPVPVATGKASAPTEPGSFNVTWKDIDHRSSEFNDAPMPYSVFFHGGEAFHQDSVYVRSNGCVHLTRSAAQTFYRTLQVGDVVQVVS